MNLLFEVNRTSIAFWLIESFFVKVTILMFVIVSTRMVKHQITELCVVIKARILVFMHIVAVMKAVLDPLRMILFQKESHHSEKQSYVQTLKVNVTFDKLIIFYNNRYGFP